jgi:osmotically-inducible protein OsmY
MSAAVLPCRLESPMMDERNPSRRILIEIAEALRRTTYLPLRQIDLRYEAETIVMQGSVPTYFLKQLAQSTAMTVRGVHQIDNQLRVTDGEQHQKENPIDPPPPISVHETSWSCSRFVLAYA